MRRILATDVEAAYNGDPAAESYGEVIFCYPALAARVLPYVVVLLVAALVGTLTWGMSSGELGKMAASWKSSLSM